MSLRGVLAGILIAIVLAVVIAGVLIGLGAYDFAADSPHAALTIKLIGLARERSIEVRTAGLKVPPLNNPAMIGRGAAHYAQMCVFCHLAPGMRENALRRGLNPKPPVLASVAPEEPAEQFWIVKHGVKMTAMPAWGTSHSDAEIWDIVAFLQKLPGISPPQYRAMTQNAQHTHIHE